MGVKEEGYDFIRNFIKGSLGEGDSQQKKQDKPVTSDKASAKIDNENTLVFWVDLKATKTEIAGAVARLYNVKPVKISTLITAKCMKKAYIRLPESVEAMNLANEMA